MEQTDSHSKIKQIHIVHRRQLKYYHFILFHKNKVNIIQCKELL